MENLLEIFSKNILCKSQEAWGLKKRGAENYRNTWFQLQAWELGNKTDHTTFLFFFPKLTPDNWTQDEGENSLHWMFVLF